MADLTAVAAALTTLRGDTLGVGSFENLDANTLATLISDTNAAAVAVNAAAERDEAILAGSATAGVVTGGDGSSAAAAFLVYLAAAGQAAWLYDMGNYLSRISLNLQIFLLPGTTINTPLPPNPPPSASQFILDQSLLDGADVLA